jgi:enoyl-CoA hydratase/carnithine racemase
MTPQEAFKLGFLARCVEENLSQEKIAEAADFFSKLAFFDFGPLKDLSRLAIAGALTAPPAAGALTAYLSNSASDTDKSELDVVRNRELINAYQQAAKKIQAQTERREYKKERKPKPNIYL